MFHATPAPSQPVATAPPSVHLSLCMIVRDSARTLPACLAGIRPFVDEIVVVDTGSQDETPRIAQEFGARVFYFPWCDSFAAARNESLRHARGRWLFWMDSDDTIDAENGDKLRRLALGSHDPAVLGYVMQVVCPAHEGGTDEATIVDHIKMFRNDPRLRFERRIHEQVLMPIRRLGGTVARTDIFVVHSGADSSAEARQRKYERDLRILNLELAEHPDDSFTLFNLGMTYHDMKQFVTAADWLERCLAVSHESESHVRKAFALLVGSYAQLNRHQKAMDVCQVARRMLPSDPELLFHEGILLHHMRRLADAATAYRGALTAVNDGHFGSIDRGITSYKARHNLAVTYRDMGNCDLAEAQWREALAQAPTFPPARLGLVEFLIAHRRFRTAELEIEQMNGSIGAACDAQLMASLLAEKQGELERARSLLNSAVENYPTRDEPLQALCRFLYEHGTLTEAEDALRCLVERRPDDGAAHHNLAQVRVRQGHLEDAVPSLRRSLDLRPDSIESWRKLADVLEALGRQDEANDAQRQMKQLTTGNDFRQ